MQVVEVFQSVQGEGSLIGGQMIFVRLWGCNMACTWCDTTYSWSPEFKYITKRIEMSPQELAKILVNNYPENVEWVNFTGGEPSLWASDIIETITLLNKKFAIQTNGKSWNEELFSKLDKICMDFKCPTSGEESNLNYLSKLSETDEAKFVIVNETDLNYVKEILKKIFTKAVIIIQPVLNPSDTLPEYFTRIKWLVDEFNEINIKNLRITPQYHQLLWRDEPAK